MLAPLPRPWAGKDRTSCVYSNRAPLAAVCSEAPRSAPDSSPLPVPVIPRRAAEKVTVALDWYPNANHAGLFLAEAQAISPPPSWRSISTRRPTRPTVLQTVGAGQRHLRDLLPDRCPAGARAGGAGRVGRRARPAPIGLRDGAGGGRDRAARRIWPAKRSATPGIPESGGVSGDDAGERWPDARRRHSGQCRVQPRAGRDLRAGRRGDGRVLDPRDDPGRAGGLPGRRSCGSKSGACPTTTSWCWSRARDGGRTAGAGDRVPDRGAATATRPRSPTPPPRSKHW